MSNFMNLILSIISLLISVAFYTLVERKVLSYMQLRKGPNKISFMGLLQPISDAVKLFNKNIMNSEISNYIFFMISPASTLMISMLIISIIPFMNFSLFDNNFNILMFLLLSSLSVYSILSIGWSSNSKYSHLGSIRCISQMISYEISFFFIILFISILSFSYNFMNIMNQQMLMKFFWGNMLIFSMWFISCLAEVNRSPFDFAEGESELVSGFNVEFMGGWFALIFMAEYLSMILLSIISSILFFGNIINIYFILFTIFISLLMLWTRATLPRFRYDLLMMMNWKFILPMIIFSLLYPLMFINFSF